MDPTSQFMRALKGDPEAQQDLTDPHSDLNIALSDPHSDLNIARSDPHSDLNIARTDPFSDHNQRSPWD